MPRPSNTVYPLHARCFASSAMTPSMGAQKSHSATRSFPESTFPKNHLAEFFSRSFRDLATSGFCLVLLRCQLPLSCQSLEFRLAAKGSELSGIHC